MARPGRKHNQREFHGVNSLTDEDKKALKDAVQEMDNSLTRIAAERDHQKTIVDDIHDKLGIDKKLFKRMARAHFKADFADEVESNNMFEEVYDMVINSK